MRRFLSIIFTIGLVFPLSGCSNEASVEQMEMRGDLAYLKGASRPFTGLVTGT